MIMPANYSVIAENELTYVNGGALEDYLAPKMVAKDWQKLSTNIVTIIGNTTVQNVVSAFVTPFFAANYVIGDVTGAVKKLFAFDTVATDWSNNIPGSLEATAINAVRGAAKVTSILAGVYTLGHVTVDGKKALELSPLPEAE